MVEGDTVRCYKHRVKSAVCFGLGMLVATALPTAYVVYGGKAMKVVLIENPKIISSILRKIYGIKKVKQDI